MRRSRGTLFMVIGALLLLIAGGLFARNMQEEEQAEVDSAQALKQIQTVIPTLEEKSEAMLNAANNPDKTALIAAQTEESQDEAAQAQQMQTIQVDDESYIGVIAIPSLNLELPVNSEWSYPKLTHSPCCYAGSFLDDTLVIAGHSVRAHFRGLRQIQVGASVAFTNAIGNVILYQVVAVETLGSTEVDKLIHNDYDLTLFTCTPGGVSRVVVRCDRI
jgi:LPXTG-site transpeptidase (sortase) family protein